MGLVPFQAPGPSGMLPRHTASEPSDLPRAMASAATRRPIWRPASMSLGNSAPASRRTCIASSALAANSAARAGNK